MNSRRFRVREARRECYYRFVNETYTKLSASCAEARKLFEDSKSGKIELATDTPAGQESGTEDTGLASPRHVQKGNIA
jgi:hypothetical protein